MSEKSAAETIESVRRLQWLCRSAIDQWRRGEIEAFRLTCQRIASEVEQDSYLAEIIEWSDRDDLERWLRIAAAVQMPTGKWERLESGIWAVRIDRLPDDVREGDSLFAYVLRGDGTWMREYVTIVWSDHNGAVASTTCYACGHLRSLCLHVGCDCVVCANTKEQPWLSVVLRRREEGEGV